MPLQQYNYPGSCEDLRINRHGCYIMEIPVLSVSHITQYEFDAIKLAIVAKEVCGFVIDEDSVDVTVMLKDVDEWHDDPNMMDLSPNTHQLFKWMLSLGYRWIRFSNECGDTIDGFPTFNW